MSEENIAVIRVIFEAFRRRDAPVMEALMDPEVEWDTAELRTRMPGLSDRGYRGPEGTREFWGEWLASWRDLQFDYDLRDAGDRVVALITNQRQWGKRSDVETEFPDYAWVYTVRDGRVTHGRFFPDHASALEANGLR
jgi:ketosteroid isomerase-like protein